MLGLKKIFEGGKNVNLRRLFNEICLIHLVNRIKNEKIFSFVLHNGLKWERNAEMAGSCTQAALFFAGLTFSFVLMKFPPIR